MCFLCFEFLMQRNMINKITTRWSILHVHIGSHVCIHIYAEVKKCEDLGKKEWEKEKRRETERNRSCTSTGFCILIKKKLTLKIGWTIWNRTGVFHIKFLQLQMMHTLQVLCRLFIKAPKLKYNSRAQFIILCLGGLVSYYQTCKNKIYK